VQSKPCLDIPLVLKRQDAAPNLCIAAKSFGKKTGTQPCHRPWRFCFGKNTKNSCILKKERDSREGEERRGLIPTHSLARRAINVFLVPFWTQHTAGLHTRSAVVFLFVGQSTSINIVAVELEFGAEQLISTPLDDFGNEGTALPIEDVVFLFEEQKQSHEG
jgi:hypothetical protein